jgi:cysteine-S-conjugate beta-lyase
MKTAKKIPFQENTRLAHDGYNPHDFHGFINPPVVRASTVLFKNSQTMEDLAQPYIYGTQGTPTTHALQNAINSLEGAHETILVPSGLAAISVPLLAFLLTDDHVLITDSVYHPTRRFADTMLKKFGIEVSYYPPDTGSRITEFMQPNTKVVFTESPASNTLEVQDISAISAAAHQRGAIVMMDNTWATPLYFKPLYHGVDISIHAATKYPGGHSDILMGTVSANEKTSQHLKEAYTNLGLCVSADDAYQILRGLRTMGVRLERHQKSALHLAKWLEADKRVAQVLHPALPSFPSHDLFKRDFSGSSGLFSIVLNGGDKQTAHRFLDALKIFGLGYSWGGYESLAIHVWLGDRVCSKPPTIGPIIRLHIGLEDRQDLQADLENALNAAFQR